MKILSLLIVVSFLTVAGNINSQNRIVKPKHYTGVVNTGNNMILGIPETVWPEVPAIGDEIAAFNQKGKLVGASVFTGGNSAITIWGDDETTKADEGMSRGTKFSLRVWHYEDGSEDVINVTAWLEGDDIYKVDGISVVSSMEVKSYIKAGDKFNLNQNIPNPASNITRIEFYLPVASHVKFILFTAEGKIVREFFSDNLPQGLHSVELNVSEFAAGNYYYKMICPGFSETKNMNVIKK